MLAGEPYDPEDEELVLARRACRERLAELNAETDERRFAALLAGLLGSAGEGSLIVPPLFCDYGTNVHLGAGCFVNAGAVMLDCAAVTLGDRTQVGPGVQLLAADHPREAARRAAGIEMASPVTVGADIWIGGGAILCPGVSVGDGSVIGAGSVVVRDVPAGVLAAGNPCRVIRAL